MASLWLNLHALPTLYYTLDLMAKSKEVDGLAKADLIKCAAVLKWAFERYGVIPSSLLILCLERYVYDECFDSELMVYKERENQYYFSSVKPGIFQTSKTAYNKLEYSQNVLLQPDEKAAGGGKVKPKERYQHPYDPEVFFHNFIFH